MGRWLIIILLSAFNAFSFADEVGSDGPQTALQSGSEFSVKLPNRQRVSAVSLKWESGQVEVESIVVERRNNGPKTIYDSGETLSRNNSSIEVTLNNPAAGNSLKINVKGLRSGANQFSYSISTVAGNGGGGNGNGNGNGNGGGGNGGGGNSPPGVEFDGPTLTFSSGAGSSTQSISVEKNLESLKFLAVRGAGKITSAMGKKRRGADVDLLAGALEVTVNRQNSLVISMSGERIQEIVITAEATGRNGNDFILGVDVTEAEAPPPASNCSVVPVVDGVKSVKHGEVKTINVTGAVAADSVLQSCTAGYSGQVVVTYKQKQTLSCSDGNLSRSPVSRDGVLSTDDSACVAVPKLCKLNPAVGGVSQLDEGQRNVEVDITNDRGVSVDSEVQSCPSGYSGNKIVTYKRLQSLSCSNQRVTKSAIFRGAVLKLDDNCKKNTPPPPQNRACKLSPAIDGQSRLGHGLSLLKNVTDSFPEDAEVLSCPRGQSGSIKRIFEKMMRVTCDDGVLSNGSISRGASSEQNSCVSVPVTPQPGICPPGLQPNPRGPGRRRAACVAIPDPVQCRPGEVPNPHRRLRHQPDCILAPTPPVRTRPSRPARPRSARPQPSVAVETCGAANIGIIGIGVVVPGVTPHPQTVFVSGGVPVGGKIEVSCADFRSLPPVVQRNQNVRSMTMVCTKSPDGKFMYVIDDPRGVQSGKTCGKININRRFRR